MHFLRRSFHSQSLRDEPQALSALLALETRLARPTGRTCGFTGGAEMSAPIETILERLEGVRQSGRSHMAKCPAHEDRSPSLRISETQDGTVLLKCLSGCYADDICAAIGLALRDLFPPRTESERHQYRNQRRTTALMRALDHERLVVELLHADMVAGHPLSATDRDRLALADQRIALVEKSL